MHLEKIEKSDFAEILSMIREEFPSASVDLSFLEARLSERNVFLLKFSRGEKIAGFIDLEVSEEGFGRIAVLLVRREFRGQDVGKEILKEAIAFLKAKAVERVSVLVRGKNLKAKKLYSRAGFRFVALYESSEGTIEEMELELDESVPSYVS